MTTWFTSDTHYFHRNIIWLSKRPFASQQEMHEVMIQRWHEKVQDGDTVYILGDFSFAGIKSTIEILNRLREGKKIKIILVKGNHDQSVARCQRMGFDEVIPQDTSIYVQGKKVALSHYPYAPTKWANFWWRLKNFIRRGVWSHKELRYLDRRPVDRGGWLFHGHVHNSWKRKGKMINVGVDQWDFYPVSLEELVDYASQS